ncbi:LTA synthase family protein [Flavobacterium gelatinilyticum]|uniref:LTA synthase family protein n=1 Tax=Flavobacterium gelatinilyticum TaxID=3003260 RepID=UPI002480703F|nr:alkaline phosphatase family protein [Flavobacterium gelatinilyticum]
MYKYLRVNELKVLVYRLFLAYLFYFFARILFFLFNKDLLKVTSVSDFFSLCYYGLAFDTTAILYVNLLFIVLSVVPAYRNTNAGYQKILFYLYFTTNLIAYALNFVDFIYYKYTFARTTTAVMNVLEHETNKMTLFFSFLFNYWYVFALFVVAAAFWIFLYKKVRIQVFIVSDKIKYFGFSLVIFVVTILLVVGGIRGGDFKKSTRPINIVDASRHVSYVPHSDIVLNTPFAVIRTLFSNSFKIPDYKEVTEKIILEKVQPIKQYKNNVSSKPNVVVFILESYGREYVGAFNQKNKIPNYKSYTPFLDSLSKQSMIFTNAYANGRQSIHGMSSILAGIPSFKDAFTSSPYPKQKIESLVSVLKSLGYDTSFFHNAANGSMGFLGFANILGIENYYGRTEFNDDSEFDGYWGIWDEPFLQFMEKTLETKKTPFFASVFTVSSHEPYIIPEKYKNKFPEGNIPIHKCVAYTDYALKRFFDQAQKKPWFSNTIFVFAADHCNQIYYDEYQKAVNRYAIPIIIYKPNSQYVGVDDDFAQQIDIYPTIMDMIGYDKPFRSWGRSLFDKKGQQPFVINSTGTIYQFSKGKYICTFDGSKVLGFYNKEDKDLKNNLISEKNPEMEEIELNCKAFIFDYYSRIVNKKLSTE